MRNVLFITAAILIGTSGAMAETVDGPEFGSYIAVPGPVSIERDGPNEPASRGAVRDRSEQDGPDCDRGGRGKGKDKGKSNASGHNGKGGNDGKGGKGRDTGKNGGKGGKGKGGRGVDAK